MRPTSTTNADQALQLLNEAAGGGDPFAAALIDLHLQEVEGLNLAQRVRAESAIASTRLIMLTTMGLHLDTEAWQSVGADAHQVKPVRQSRLRECLLRALGHSPEPAKTTGETATSVLRPLGLRVLLAEDNPVNQKIAIRQLRKLGCTAEAVANGFEAVDAVRRIPYDVVLMDCQMPELDGYEATRRIRQLEGDLAATGRPTVCIIAMTANALGGDRDTCLRAGMDDYISKPVKLPDLQAALAKARVSVRHKLRPPAPLTARPGEEPAIDPEVFAGLRALQEPGEPDSVAELSALFLEDTPPRVQAIRQAISTQNPSALREAAHSLKGSASNLGAKRLAAVCQQIERAARQDEILAGSELLPKLEDEYSRVCFVLERESKNQNSGLRQTE